MPHAAEFLPGVAGRGRVRPLIPPPHSDQRFDPLPGSSKEPGAAASAAGHGCCSATRAPTGSGGGPPHPQKPRAARMPSATCRRSASAAMPAGATRLLPNANSRRDFLGIQESYRQREDGCIFGALEGGGKGWAGERIRSSASPMPTR